MYFVQLRIAVDTRFNTIGAPPPAISETEEPQTTPFTPQQGSFPRHQPPDPDFGLPARITSVRSHQRVDPEFLNQYQLEHKHCNMQKR
jgi:hypothetical protein